MAIRRKFVWVLAATVVSASACNISVTTTPSRQTAISTLEAIETAVRTYTNLPIREWNLKDIRADGSTVTVQLRMYAAIDVRVTLEGKRADQVTFAAPNLSFEFRGVPPGKQTFEVSDVVGHGVNVEVVVPTP